MTPISSNTATTETSLLYSFTEFAKLKPHSVIIHRRWVNTISTQRNVKSLKNLEKGNQYNGYMSDASRRKVKGLVENYLTAVQLSTALEFPKSFPSQEVYPTFVTLTLPSKQLNCDNTIKKECFFRFLEYLQGEKATGHSGWNVKNYIWVAETQKNGNIHFHLILDRGIPADRLNQVWNRFIDRLDYVKMFRSKMRYIYQDGFYVRKDMMAAAIANHRAYCRKVGQKFVKAEVEKKERARQLKAYGNGVKSNWRNPPTTKIHSIREIKKLTAYVSKYMTKEPKAICSLPKGEKLEKRDGKYYATGFQEQFTFTTETLQNGAVNVKEGTIKVPYEREVTVKFDTCRLRGRIWGCSKALHVEDLSPLQIALESNSKHLTITQTDTTRRTEVWRERLDMFGKQNFKKEIVHQPYTIAQEHEHWSDPVRDEEAIQYVSDLRLAVSAADIKKATDRAGPMFAAFGEIIPLSTPQKDLLPSISPPLWTRYREHYQRMYNTLYPQ